VVVGLGYVGLPLAVEASRAGMHVVGLDADADVVVALSDGRSHVQDVPDSTIAEMLDQGFSATTDPSAVAQAATIVICVPTPLDPDGGPDLSAVRAVAVSIAPHMPRGVLVVLESTSYPGTTAEVLSPLLEAGSGLTAGPDFHVAYSPERIDPGNLTYGLRNTPKIVGADTEHAKEAVVAFYDRVVDTVVVARGILEAESAKLLENTYRHVNIALVNEMARFFHELGIDFWNVIELASTKPFGFQAFRPGPGVGGHCIPIDPNYLSHRVRSRLGYGFRFVELAQEINAAMPGYVADRSTMLLNDQFKPVRGSRVLLVGVTYKADVADQRESPANTVAKLLVEHGAELWFHDPYVTDLPGVNAIQVHDVLEAAGQADLTILLQDHQTYDIEALESSAVCLLDTRGVTRGDRAVRL
jgi:UDP-N-acetyl-D-glucosamine dehydrogenase